MELVQYISRVIYVVCVLCLHSGSPYITVPHLAAWPQHWSVNNSLTLEGSQHT
jgi:hypothetical protein